MEITQGMQANKGLLHFYDYDVIVLTIKRCLYLIIKHLEFIYRNNFIGFRTYKSGSLDK